MSAKTNFLVHKLTNNIVDYVPISSSVGAGALLSALVFPSLHPPPLHHFQGRVLLLRTSHIRTYVRVLQTDSFRSVGTDVSAANP